MRFKLQRAADGNWIATCGNDFRIGEVVTVDEVQALEAKLTTARAALEPILKHLVLVQESRYSILDLVPDAEKAIRALLAQIDAGTVPELGLAELNAAASMQLEMLVTQVVDTLERYNVCQRPLPTNALNSLRAVLTKTVKSKNYPEPRPGTWEWARAMMKTGKAVTNPDREIEGGWLLYGWCPELRINAFIDCEGGLAILTMEDFDGNEWRVADATEGGDDELGS